MGSSLKRRKNIKLSNIEKEYFKKAGVNTKTKEFRRHYRRGYLNKHDLEFAKKVRNYFSKHLNKDIDPVSHLAYYGVTGKKDVRIVPSRLFRSHYLWVFNDRPMTDAYLDKNTYDLLFDTPHQVHTVLKRVRGHYFDHHNNLVDDEEVNKILLFDSPEYIIKPSDTNNGAKINKIIVKDNNLELNNQTLNIKEIEKLYGYNFLIQRVIQQHPIMSRPHPSSVNTLRMVTLRWNHKIENLYTFARFGVDYDVKDNAGAGGLSVGVKDNGDFMDYGIRRNRKVYEHPTTKVKIHTFGTVPNYLAIQKFVRELHKKILHHDYVSWDIAVDPKGYPIFIEANFFGSSFLNQIALERPTFGDRTEDILNYIRENIYLKKDRDVNIRISGRRLKTIQKLRRDRKIKEKKIKQYQTEIKENKKEIVSLQNEIKRIKNSRSWRYTSIFRRK